MAHFEYPYLIVLHPLCNKDILLKEMKICYGQLSDQIFCQKKLISFDSVIVLILKAPNKNCSRRHFNFSLLSFEGNEIRLDFSCEFSA